MLNGYGSGRASAFVVAAGDRCSFSGPDCVTSPSFPLAYGAYDSCTITVMQDGLVRSTSFDTEAGNDFVRMNGVQYDGTTGPMGVEIIKYSKIEFHADGRVHGLGWKLCLEAPSSEHKQMDGTLSMDIVSLDGSRAESCPEQQLRHCTEYNFRCDMQNIAGHSAGIELEVVRTLPGLPPKPYRPIINQYEQGIGFLSDRFTVISENPNYLGDGRPDLACSDYTFRVTVRDTSTDMIVMDKPGLPLGNNLVDGLTPATEYSVTVQASNQVRTRCECHHFNRYIIIEG